MKVEGNQLPTPQSVLHHWPTPLPPFTESTKYSSTSSHFTESLNSLNAVMPAFHWSHSCPFQDTELFSHITGLVQLCIWLQKSHLYLWVPTEAVALSPPNHLPLALPSDLWQLAPALWRMHQSGFETVRMGLPWSYTMDHV